MGQNNANNSPDASNVDLATFTFIVFPPCQDAACCAACGYDGAQGLRLYLLINLASFPPLKQFQTDYAVLFLSEPTGGRKLANEAYGHRRLVNSHDTMVYRGGVTHHLAHALCPFRDYCDAQARAGTR